jgi:glucose-1-phosphate thymidylyltransferase
VKAARTATVKALVLAGGAGTRLRPITYTSAKQLVPVANRPILFFGLDALAEAGVTEVVMIVGDTEADIRAAVGSGEQWGMTVSYVRQEAPLGLAHAVKVARRALGDEPFVMWLGDNLLEQSVVPLVERFNRRAPEVAALVLLAEVDDPSRFGVAEFDADGALVGLVEKPIDPPSNLALVGVYLFDQRIHEVVAGLEPSARGELEITDAIDTLLSRGDVVEVERTTGWWIDTGKLTPLLEANRLLLARITTRIDGDVDAATQIDGPVVIAAGAVVRNSRLQGPLVIGEGVVVDNCAIGPNVAVGAGSTLRASIISEAVLMERVTIDGVGPLQDSLIGRDASICRGPLALNIGDHCQLWLP